MAATTDGRKDCDDDNDDDDYDSDGYDNHDMMTTSDDYNCDEDENDSSGDSSRRPADRIVVTFMYVG